MHNKKTQQKQCTFNKGQLVKGQMWIIQIMAVTWTKVTDSQSDFTKNHKRVAGLKNYYN